METRTVAVRIEVEIEVEVGSEETDTSNDIRVLDKVEALFDHGGIRDCFSSADMTLLRFTVE